MHRSSPRRPPAKASAVVRRPRTTVPGSAPARSCTTCRARATPKRALSSATFLDSSTLGVLAISSKRFRERELPFAVVCPPGDVRTMFELTALDRVVAVHGTRAEALAALGA